MKSRSRVGAQRAAKRPKAGLFSAAQNESKKPGR
jgi:hypothetical protein